jgi:peptidoglycan/LPS O-acetylase OafA/YrhL
MLLGVFLHSALAYAQPAQSFWLATDPESSVAIDASIWFIHLFRMSLFFFLSGYFAKLVIEKKGVKNFLWNRFLRIVVPFVLFYPFLLAAMIAVIVFALSYLTEPQGLMGMIATAAKDNAGAQKSQSNSTMHLWFLYYLAFFSVLGALLHRFKGIQLDSLFRNPLFLLLSPLVLVPSAFAAGSPVPAPESFIPLWWPLVFYGWFYAAGWQLFGRENCLESLRPYAWHILGISVLLFIPYYLLLPVMNLKAMMDAPSPQNAWVLGTEALLTAYLSATLTIAFLLLGNRYLSGRSPFLAFVADASYWVYLLHLPIAIFLQTLLIPAPLPLWLKLLAVLSGTLTFCFATYVVFVRYTPLGWLLHGKRSFP